MIPVPAQKSAVELAACRGEVWESCVSKHIDGQKLEQSNQNLKEAGIHMRKEWAVGVVPVIE
jgi:hypothetical protein